MRCEGYTVFGKHKNRLYRVGGDLYDLGVEIDTFLRQFPVFKEISITSYVKRKLKWAINKAGREKIIDNEVDANPNLKGTISGHDHTPGMRLTGKGKLVLNPGSSTEDGVQSIHQDRNGKFIRINWYQDGLLITDFTGATARRSYVELGLAYHAWPPASIDDGHREDAKRLLGIIYRLAPPLDRREAASMVLQAEEAAEALTVPVDPSHLPPPAKRRISRRATLRPGLRKRRIAEELSRQQKVRDLACELLNNPGYMPTPRPDRRRACSLAAPLGP